MVPSCPQRTTHLNIPDKELAFCIIAGDVWSEKVYVEYFSKAQCPIFVVTGLRVTNSSQKSSQKLFQWSPSAWTVFFCLTKLACKHVKIELAEGCNSDVEVYFHVYYRNDAKGAVVNEICERTIREEYTNLRQDIYNCSIEELMAQDKKLLHEHFQKKGDHRVIIYGFGSEYSNLLNSIGGLKKENGMVINVYGDINALPEKIEDDQRIRTDYLVSTFVEEHIRTSPQYMALYYSELIRFCAKVLDKSLSGSNKESLEKKYDGKVGCFFRDKLNEVRFHYSDKYGSIYFANDGGFCAPLYLLSNGKQCSVLPEIQMFSESSTDELAQQLSKIDGYIQNFSPISMDLNLKISECDSDNTIGTQSLKGLLNKLHAEIFSSYFGATETLFISRLPNTVRDFFSTGIDIKGTQIVDPILEFLDVNGIANAIQINLREQDIEDNGVLRLYVKYGENAIKPYYYWSKGNENADSVVFAHTIELAGSSTMWEPVEAGNSWCMLLQSLKGLSDKGNSYIYLIPESNVSKKCSFVMLCTSRKLSLFDIQMGQNLVARIFSRIQIAIRENGLMLANTKSAIGSIMSRNGSHNIGSHVLAALSHNVGTMPDDRVLYQYIQHRMDYIATATTEFPFWRQPTMLVSNIIREFLRQKHLLDYISSSEGLHAYNFQGHFAANEQENSIRIHVRRVEQRKGWETNGCIDCGVIVDFVVYPGVHGEENVAKKVDFEKDLAIDVPGGTVGNHAFFTIIENVLRNAAKHEWAVAVKYWKKLQEEKEGIERLLSSISDSKCSEAAECWKLLGDSKGIEDIEGLLRNKSEVEKIVRDLEERLKTTSEKLPVCKPTNLDLYVDFADNPGQGVVECRVWTNIAVTSREYQSANLASLKKVLEEKIGASFIDDATGRLRKENWGIAEMRISAGYLQGRDISDIGGLTSRKKALEIIRPVIVNAGCGVNCLGYRFDVYKPRELLVVIKDSRSFKDEGVLAAANTKAMQYGIAFKRESEVLSAKSNPYSYILFEELNLNDPAKAKKYKGAKLPYRVLGWRVQHACDDKDDGKVSIPKRLHEAAHYNGTIFNKDGGNDLEENLRKICDLNNDGSEICYALLEEVYRFWLDKIRRNKRDGSCRKLVLDLGLKGDKSGARKSLVSDCDLLKFVFAHTFGAAVRSFLATKNESEVTEECAALLLAIISMPNRQLASAKELAAKYSGKSVSEVSPEDEHELLSNEFAIVYNQIGIWSEELLKDGHEVVLAAEGVPPNWWVTFENRGWIVTIDEWDVFSKDKDNDSAIDKLIEYILTVILKQAEAFLRKYEEEIATLPKGFSVESNGTSFSWEWDAGRQEIDFTCDQATRNAHVNEDFCYFRHGEKAFPTLIDSYYEALSGAQCSFNALVPFQNAVSIVDVAERRANGEEIHDRLYLQNKNIVVRFMTRLVENSTLKMLIIDERVKKFMDDHSNVRNNIGGLGIVVRDHNDNAVRDMFSEDEGKNFLDINFSDDVSADAKTKVCLKTFDIIVIHQGIIDKLLKNHESKESVGAWLEKMESFQRYVVITTGRGSPANIPDEARVLPYSVIESSILQRFPEKMILVDTIMNLLPSVKEN